MAELGRKFLYRIFCVVALLIALYLLIDLYLSHTLDIKVMVLFGIVFSVIIFGFFDWTQNYTALIKSDMARHMQKGI